MNPSEDLERRCREALHRPSGHHADGWASSDGTSKPCTPIYSITLNPQEVLDALAPERQRTLEWAAGVAKAECKGWAPIHEPVYRACRHIAEDILRGPDGGGA